MWGLLQIGDLGRERPGLWVLVTGVPITAAGKDSSPATARLGHPASVTRKEPCCRPGSPRGDREPAPVLSRSSFSREGSAVDAARI